MAQGRAYANIVARPDYSGQLVQGQTCRLENFKVTADVHHDASQACQRRAAFQGSGNPGGTASRISSAVMRKATAPSGSTPCGRRKSRITSAARPHLPQLQAQIDGVFQEEWRAGERRQDAYDRADQQKLVRHPLIQAAASARRKVRAAYAAQPTQSPAATAPGWRQGQVTSKARERHDGTQRCRTAAARSHRAGDAVPAELRHRVVHQDDARARSSTRAATWRASARAWSGPA
jgi:hypothetical protein